MNMNVYTNTNMNEMRGIIKGWGGGGERHNTNFNKIRGLKH
jgi:hypothetical protein